MPAHTAVRPGCSPPILGAYVLHRNIHEVHELGAHEFQRKYARIYGPIYQSWCFQGPEVVLASPELIRCASPMMQTRIG